MGITLVGHSNADPMQPTAFKGVGSDTVQDVANAFAGFTCDGVDSTGTSCTHATDYTPLHTSAATGFVQMISYDAVNPIGVTGACITTKAGAASFDRPNGSGAGQKALSRAIDGGKYGSAACSGPSNVTPSIDFSRSSSGPDTSGATQLAFVPFGRDGVSFAAYRKAGSPVTSLKQQDLVSIYTTGSGNFDSTGTACTAGTAGCVRIIPCGIQTSSGTHKFWVGQNAASPGVLGVYATEATATTECNNLLGAGVRAEENSGDALKARGDALAATTANAGDEVIIGFSAASWTAKVNGAAPPAGASNVTLGSITDNGAGVALGSPVVASGSPVTYSANPTFFNDATFGRRVYFVLPYSVINSAFGNDALKSMFAGSTSAVCSASSTIAKFGFETIGAACGDTTTYHGGLVAGQL
jgi:hypothetical protein